MLSFSKPFYVSLAIAAGLEITLAILACSPIAYKPAFDQPIQDLITTVEPYCTALIAGAAVVVAIGLLMMKRNAPAPTASAAQQAHAQ